MAALLNFATTTAAPRYEVPGDIRGMINRLRFRASLCRASARLDIHEACRLLPVADDPDEGAVSTLFLRVLGQALERPPVWLKPGAADFSFDELWLARVLITYQKGDGASLAFLIDRRIPKEKRRVFRLLVASLSRALG
ncbi:MAG: hypothetical protein AAGJ96_00690 [Pseudomonadota bacterium]